MVQYIVHLVKPIHSYKGHGKIYLTHVQTVDARARLFSSLEGPRDIAIGRVCYEYPDYINFVYEPSIKNISAGMLTMHFFHCTIQELAGSLPSPPF